MKAQKGNCTALESGWVVQATHGLLYPWGKSDTHCTGG